MTSLVFNKLGTFIRTSLDCLPGLLFHSKILRKIFTFVDRQIYTEVNCHTLRTFALRFMGPS